MKKNVQMNSFDARVTSTGHRKRRIEMQRQLDQGTFLPRFITSTAQI
jgi:hypothetical protein